MAVRAAGRSAAGALQLRLQARSAASRFSSGGWSAKTFISEFFARAGMMKKALMPSAVRRSLRGIRSIVPLILISAEASALGRPVRIAEPRSAANSR